MTYPVNIIAAVVDKHNLTMYTETGDTITVPQGDPRIKDLVSKVVPVVSRNEVYVLTSEDMTGKNHYAEVEKQSNGLVRFFKMAKAKFKEIAEKFCEPVAPVSAGKIPVPMEHSVTGAKAEEAIADPIGQDLTPPAPKLPPEEQRPLTKGEAAVAEIMANAVTPADKDFATVRDADMARDSGEEEEMVVAVLQDNTVIHGVEQLNDQFKAVTAGVTSVDGMQLFLNRAGSVTRGHSVEDLLKFVQKGELPFADDGTVLVYKRLQSTKEEGVFVDCHSGRVKQRVGSFVHMAESLVDPNRNQDCSNGLHVARRDYLGSFSGDVLVLCKLAPEDVIAVPKYDARKLRAKGYHIIARLSQEDADRVCSNQPMKDTELLANAIAGNHPPILEYVEITQQRGGGLKVSAAAEVPAQEVKPVREATSLDHVPEVGNVPVEVDARAVALSLGEQKLTTQAVTGPVVDEAPAPVPVPVEVETAKPAHKLSERDQLLLAFNEASVPSAKLEAAKGILAFKKAKKKSWTALGIPTSVWTKAQEIVEAADMGAKYPVTKADLKPAVEAVAKTLPKSKPSNDDKALKAMAKPAAKVKGKNSVTKAPRPSASKPTPTVAKGPAPKEKKMTQQEEMAKLVELYKANPDKANARAIFNFKQSSKKGWEKLGVTDKKFQAKITERAKL